MLVRRVLRRLGLRSEDALHLPQLVHGQQRKHLRHWRQLRGGHGLRPMRVLLSLVRGLLLWQIPMSTQRANSCLATFRAPITATRRLTRVSTIPTAPRSTRGTRLRTRPALTTRRTRTGSALSWHASFRDGQRTSSFRPAQFGRKGDRRDHRYCHRCFSRPRFGSPNVRDTGCPSSPNRQEHSLLSSRRGS